jgi:hypothetical protein
MGAISPDHNNLRMTANDAEKFGFFGENRQIRRMIRG